MSPQHVERGRLIVPLRSEKTPPAEPGAPAPAAAAYGGGPLLTAVEVYTIFWGATWQQAPQNGLVPQINKFFDYILTSCLMDLLAQYSVPGQAIGHGTRIGSTTITNSEPGGGGGQITDAQVQQALQQWTTDGKIPGPTRNTLYFVYLPPGVTVTDPQGGQSCQAMCGYHWYAGDRHYAVMPDLGCQNCQDTGHATFEDITAVSSHELCEAITDPEPWTG
jgi:hypothetical protein